MSDIKYYIYRDGKAIGLMQNEERSLATLQDEFADSMTVGRMLINKEHAGESWTQIVPKLSEPFEIKVMQGDKLLVWREAWITTYGLSAVAKNVVIIQNILLSFKPTDTKAQGSIQRE